MEFELNIIRSIQSVASPFLDGLFQLITMFGEEAILPKKLVFDFIRYFMVVFFGIGLYPAIFKKFKL